MKTARIEYSLDGPGRAVAYESNFDLTPFIKARDLVDPLGPVLLIEVRDPEDAAALVAAIEKVDRTPPKPRKQRKTKSPASSTNGLPAGGPQSSGAGDKALLGSAAKPGTPPSGKAAEPGKEEMPPPAKCIVPGCTYDADFGSDFCVAHPKATEAEKAEWRKANGQRRARAIGEQIQVAP